MIAVLSPSTRQTDRYVSLRVLGMYQATPGVVTVHEDRRHGLETGDWVAFEEVQGMTQLNQTEPRQIKVLTPFSFAIEDTTGFSPYTGEGYFQQVFPPVV